MTLLVINGTRHWLSISNLFLKNIKAKGHQCPELILSCPYLFNISITSLELLIHPHSKNAPVS